VHVSSIDNVIHQLNAPVYKATGLRARFSKHNRYIKYNDPKSAYALHILNNHHEYNTIQNTMQLIKPYKRGWYMNIAESLYI
jgi:hypothetical protein